MELLARDTIQFPKMKHCKRNHHGFLRCRRPGTSVGRYDFPVAREVDHVAIRVPDLRRRV